VQDESTGTKKKVKVQKYAESTNEDDDDPHLSGYFSEPSGLDNPR
jgi:hypothetical protein